ncbi:unnamed protein product [Ranitomeya imitator]|uniref:Uncharacterized protein n=1 Tax=Ranitomeya imitator TaxID=111125 RepID=A0ABN9LT30_9NEOB|nr:unnamed protein product [Ranitomeya imitator]
MAAPGEKTDGPRQDRVTLNRRTWKETKLWEYRDFVLSPVLSLHCRARMWSEVVLVLQGGSRVAQAVVKMGCEELRVASATSTLGSGIRSLQSAAERCVSAAFTNLQVNKTDSRERPPSSDFDAESWSVMSDLPPAEEAPSSQPNPAGWERRARA